MLWEPRPRGDGWWSAGVIATGASLLQGDFPCGSPALGAMGGGLRRLSRRGRRSDHKPSGLQIQQRQHFAHITVQRCQGLFKWKMRHFITDQFRHGLGLVQIAWLFQRLAIIQA